MSGRGTSSDTKGKVRQLWQIFFDDDKQENGASSGKFKPMVLLDKNKSNRNHGVLYRGLPDVESDSDDDVIQGMPGQFEASSGEDPGDLTFKDQDRVAFANSLLNANCVQNYNKPFNAREWEAVEITPNPNRTSPERLSQDGGARFIIRSESDLELAIPVNKRSRRRYLGCCPKKSSQSESFEYCTCLVLALVAMAAVYVAVVICIVYGFK